MLILGIIQYYTDVAQIGGTGRSLVGKRLRLTGVDAVDGGPVARHLELTEVNSHEPATGQGFGENASWRDDDFLSGRPIDLDRPPDKAGEDIPEPIRFVDVTQRAF